MAQLTHVTIKVGRAKQLVSSFPVIWILFAYSMQKRKGKVSSILFFMSDSDFELGLSCQPWVTDYSLWCRNCQWRWTFSWIVCESLCTFLYYTGGDRGGFFESCSLQPTWRKTTLDRNCCPVQYTTCIMIDLHNVLWPWVNELSTAMMIKMMSSCTLDCASTWVV